jgi:hypothetical protein
MIDRDDSYSFLGFKSSLEFPRFLAEAATLSDAKAEF